MHRGRAGLWDGRIGFIKILVSKSLLLVLLRDSYGSLDTGGSRGGGSSDRRRGRGCLLISPHDVK